MGSSCPDSSTTKYSGEIPQIPLVKALLLIIQGGIYSLQSDFGYLTTLPAEMYPNVSLENLSSSRPKIIGA